jgi:hypothetical protein
MTTRSKINKILYFQDGKEHLVNNELFFKDKSYVGLIRLQVHEVRNLPSEGEFIHFNFQRGGHIIGEKYALPLIIRSGYMTDNNEEILPLLYIKDCKVAKCIDIQENVKYKDIPTEYLKKSLYDSLHDLKATLKNKYSGLLADMNQDDFEKAGVGITKLRIIGR